VGDTEVTAAPWVPRSRSREATYPHDLTSREEIEDRVVEMARELAHEVIADGRRVVRVAVKVRYSPYFTQTHIRTCPAPTTDVAEVERWALHVLELFDLTRPVRLLGVRVELEPLEPAPP
jgi:DNA polymerase-4